VGDVGAAQPYAAAAEELVCLVLGLPGGAEDWRTGSACTTLEDFAQRGLALSVDSTAPQGRWAPRAMLVPNAFDAPHEGWAPIGSTLWVETDPRGRARPSTSWPDVTSSSCATRCRLARCRTAAPATSHIPRSTWSQSSSSSAAAGRL
jgi:hypothetical protein